MSHERSNGVSKVTKKAEIALCCPRNSPPTRPVFPNPIHVNINMFWGPLAPQTPLVKKYSNDIPISQSHNIPHGV